MDKEVNSSNRHVLYISYDGMTDPLGQSQVLPYLEGLSKKDYVITLISFEKEDRKGDKEKIKKLTESMSIDWLPLTYTKWPPVISTIRDLLKLYRKTKQLLAVKHFSIVHCRSYISALIGLRLKKNHGIKFVFDMRGFWVDERIEGGVWNMSNPLFRVIYRFFKHKEKQFLRESDYIISLTKNGKRTINVLYGDNTPPIEVIPCCVDSDHFDYSKIEADELLELKSKLSIDEDNFVLSYLGSIGTWYMLSEMLDFFKLLLAKKNNSIFLFITADNPTEIMDCAHSKGIDKERLRVKVAKRDEVPKMLAVSDVSLFFIKPVFSKKASSPTKLGEIMSMGIPVICNGKVGDIEEVVDQNVGSIVADFSVLSYKQAIDDIPKLLEKEKSSIRNHAITHFNLQDGIRIYEHVYEHLFT